MNNIFLFDWGDTLMVDFPHATGKMCDWKKVEAVEGAKETLECLSKNAKIYVATGAAESTEIEIKKAFDRVNLSQYITGYFCKANTGFSKGSPDFLEAILHKLKEPKKNVVMVGNSLEKDILPAHKIGIKAIWLTPISNKDTPPNTKIISNLKDILLFMI